MPKKILIFITLKVAEITGIVFLPYWIGKINVEWWVKFESKEYFYVDYPFFYTWLCGFIDILILGAILIVIYLLYTVNKDWTNKIYDKWFDK